MASLDSSKLHDFLSDKARSGTLVTEEEVVTKFGVEIGAVRKCLGLLTGNCVLEEKLPGQYDCKNVLRCSKQAFDSARSQGKTNQEYVRSLLREIERLNKNNEVLREKLMSAQKKLRDIGVEP